MTPTFLSSVRTAAAYSPEEQYAQSAGTRVLSLGTMAATLLS